VSPAPVEIEFALAGLLNQKTKPTAAELDTIFESLVQSQEYKRMIASEANSEELAGLLDHVRSVPKVPVGDSVALAGAGTGLSESKKAAEVPSVGIELSSVDLSSAPAPKPRMRFASFRAGGVPYSAVSAGEFLPEETVAKKGRMVARATASSAAAADIALIDPEAAQLESTKYIITTIDTLTHILVVLSSVEGDVNAGNYLTVVAKVDSECNYVLSKLVEEAIDRIVTNDDFAAKWKKALRQILAQMTAYTETKPGPDTWEAFKAQTIDALSVLVDYAMVAKTTAEENAVTAAPGDSNAVLEQKLETAVVDTGCLCLWKCMYRICRSTGAVSETTTTPLPPVAPGIAGPNSERLKALQLVLFIDSTVVTIQGIVKQVRELETSGPEGEERLKNLKLRIGLQLMSMLRQAIANDALDKIYDAIKNRSLYLLGTLSGVTSAAGGWDAIKGAVSDSLNAIVADLDASKPTVL